MYGNIYGLWPHLLVFVARSSSVLDEWQYSHDIVTLQDFCYAFLLLRLQFAWRRRVFYGFFDKVRFRHFDLNSDSFTPLITITNYFSQDWNDFNFAVRISSLRFSFSRDWNDKFQLRCSNFEPSFQFRSRLE